MEREWQKEEWMICPLGLESDEVLHTVLGVEPADTESLWRRWNKNTNTEELYLRFASNDNGGYLLKLEKGVSDPMVYEWFYEGGIGLLNEIPDDVELDKVSDHFSQFISWPKEKI